MLVRIGGLCFLLLLAACGGNLGAEPAAEAQSGPGDAAVASTPTAEPEAAAVDLPDLGAAPEINNEVWLNSDAPVTLASVRGEKVVLLEFWTFGCINCRRAIPYVRDWYERFAGDDFVVVSVHYPEFAYERDVANVRRATQELGVAYPVAIDNERETWGAYNQRYWPTTYLIDKNGRIRLVHIGEFNGKSAAEMEAAIAALRQE